MSPNHLVTCQRASSWRAHLATASAAALCASALAAAQPGSAPHGIDEYRKARAAFQEKQYGQAVVYLKALLAVAPSHPGVMARLARAYLAAGQPEQALESLDRAISLGGGLGVLRDEAFVRFLDTPQAQAAAARLEALKTPAGASRVAFRVAERDLIPEGIAYDPETGAFFLSSIYRRKIVRIDPGGRVSDFTASKQDGLLCVLGMKVDARRRALWVATEGGEPMIDASPSDTLRSAVFEYDLGSGKLVKAYWAPADATRHLFNDLVVDSRGEVLVTDTEEGALYAIGARTGRLERLLPPSTWDYPNGIALSADERTAYVAHAWGITLVDRATGRLRELEAPPGVTTVGMDGLYTHGGELIGVQNGIEPARVVAFALNEAGDRVVGARTIARNHPSFDTPTTGVIVGDSIYFIANSQITAFSPDGTIFPHDRLHDVVVLESPLR